MHVNPLSLRHFSDYQGTKVPLDVLAAGQEHGVVGLAEWPRYTHEEVLEAIRYLSLDFNRYCQDIDRVIFVCTYLYLLTYFNKHGTLTPVTYLPQMLMLCICT